MADPYRILGVSPTATDDEIKTAYRKLTQQYHPDRQQDPVMADIATEKMAEINAAYDEIMNMRRNANYSTSGNFSQYSNDIYREIRSHIEHGNYTIADEMLDRNRNDGYAEWNYLKGIVCSSRGWLNDAYSYFEKAVRLDPSNREYQMAYNQLKSQRSGHMSGNPYGNTASADRTCNTLCNICQCILCADCLCDCCGT